MVLEEGIISLLYVKPLTTVYQQWIDIDFHEWKLFHSENDDLWLASAPTPINNNILRDRDTNTSSITWYITFFTQLLFQRPNNSTRNLIRSSNESRDVGHTDEIYSFVSILLWIRDQYFEWRAAKARGIVTIFLKILSVIRNSLFILLFHTSLYDLLYILLLPTIHSFWCIR